MTEFAHNATSNPICLRPLSSADEFLIAGDLASFEWVLQFVAVTVLALAAWEGVMHVRRSMTPSSSKAKRKETME